MKVTSKSIEIGGRPLTLEVGRFAQQATAAVLARYGDTMVIATVVASARESNLDYFPLSVEYVERLYAGGRIKGSRWVKRERNTDEEALSARLVDRSIRPGRGAKTGRPPARVRDSRFSTDETLAATPKVPANPIHPGGGGHAFAADRVGGGCTLHFPGRYSGVRPSRAGILGRD